MFVGSSYILNGNSLKVYMLAYNHMEICILFWKVDRTSFKAVITLFEKVISRKKLALFGELVRGIVIVVKLLHFNLLLWNSE